MKDSEAFAAVCMERMGRQCEIVAIKFYTDDEEENSPRYRVGRKGIDQFG